MATLTDTGPLLAIIDHGQPQHTACIEALSNVSVPLVTTVPCFTEAMYLLAARTRNGTKELWRLFTSGRLTIHHTTDVDLQRMKVLMEKYSDVPMSLADASLVVAAEARKVGRIFTLDSDFRVYRYNDTSPFEVLP